MCLYLLLVNKVEYIIRLKCCFNYNSTTNITFVNTYNYDHLYTDVSLMTTVTTASTIKSADDASPTPPGQADNKLYTELYSN